MGVCIQIWAPCLNQWVAQLEGGQRQALRQIRGLENVTSQESLQLISLKKKVLGRQHNNSHQTHKSLMWSREAKLTIHAHSGCPTQESSLPAREDWTTCDLARTRLIRHCRRMHGEALAHSQPCLKTDQTGGVIDPVLRQEWPLYPAALIYFHFRAVQMLLGQNRALTPLSQALACANGCQWKVQRMCKNCVTQQWNKVHVKNVLVFIFLLEDYGFMAHCLFKLTQDNNRHSQCTHTFLPFYHFLLDDLPQW